MKDDGTLIFQTLTELFSLSETNSCLCIAAITKHCCKYIMSVKCLKKKIKMNKISPPQFKRLACPVEIHEKVSVVARCYYPHEEQGM